MDLVRATWLFSESDSEWSFAFKWILFVSLFLKLRASRMDGEHFSPPLHVILSGIETWNWRWLIAFVLSIPCVIRTFFQWGVGDSHSHILRHLTKDLPSGAGHGPKAKRAEEQAQFCSLFSVSKQQVESCFRIVAHQEFDSLLWHLLDMRIGPFALPHFSPILWENWDFASFFCCVVLIS